LLGGATGYLIKRGRGRSSHLAMNRSSFLRWLRLLQRLRLEKGGPGRLASLSTCSNAGAGAAGGSVWVQLGAAGGGLKAFPPEREPFMRAGEWMALALASSYSLPLMVDALCAAPERPAGPVVLSVPQSRRFCRALREVVSRRWNHTVLDLEGGEHLRPGQWRVLPGRFLLAPHGHARGMHCFDLLPSRLADEQRSASVQLQLLEAIEPGLLQIFLVEQPQGPLLDSVRNLVLKGHAVFLHTHALGMRAEIRHGGRR
ncbi:MAG: hypothetical protein KAY24_19380, partial [Candidatus Eisenbacteria sp.]|nr:hypothetical protein [Candidatus Eisenbacteria bacterium]